MSSTFKDLKYSYIDLMRSLWPSKIGFCLVNKFEEEYLNLYLTHRSPQDEVGVPVTGNIPEKPGKPLELYVQ